MKRKASALTLIFACLFSTLTGAVVVASTKENTWESMAPLPETTGEEGMFAVGTTLTQVYDPENDTWTLGEPMPTARLGLTVAVANDQIYAIAGTALMAFSPRLKANERYTPFGYGTPDPTYDGTSPELFPAVLVAVVSLVVIAIISAGLLVYFKKRNR